jgi:hypothetical protein
VASLRRGATWCGRHTSVKGGTAIPPVFVPLAPATELGERFPCELRRVLGEGGLRTGGIGGLDQQMDGRHRSRSQMTDQW